MTIPTHPIEREGLTSTTPEGEGLVERLREKARFHGGLHTETAAVLSEAADALQALIAERDGLKVVVEKGWISGDKRVSPVLLEKEMGQSFVRLVWAVKPGAVRLLAVCSDERRADHYAANMPPGLTDFKSWKERAPLDHGFGFADSMHARVQGKL